TLLRPGDRGAHPAPKTRSAPLPPNPTALPPHSCIRAPRNRSPPQHPRPIGVVPSDLSTHAFPLLATSTCPHRAAEMKEPSDRLALIPSESQPILVSDSRHSLETAKRVPHPRFRN